LKKFVRIGAGQIFCKKREKSGKRRGVGIGVETRTHTL